MINNFLGIDISKERFDVFLSFVNTKGKREIRKKSFKNEDSGFQGWQKLQKNVVILYKKYRKKPLTEEQPEL